MKRLVLGIIVVVAVVFSLSPSTVLAQDMCVGDFDYDTDCDGTDAAVFKSDFGRGGYSNPCPPNGPAPVPKTGQASCYEGISPPQQIDCAGTGQDGEYQMGVALPEPRFTDNGDGTVTDNLTGLVWLKNASCFEQSTYPDYPDTWHTWQEALDSCNGLGGEQCGLTDGSNAGDWRLPNRRELFSLIYDDYFNPAVQDTAGTGKWSEGDPFTNVQSNRAYWSSATAASYTGYAWTVSMGGGHIGAPPKQYIYNVWCVRGGH